MKESTGLLKRQLKESVRQCEADAVAIEAVATKAIEVG